MTDSPGVSKTGGDQQAGPPGGLLNTSVAAVKWNYLGALARIVSQIFVQAGMARLLGPDLLGRFSLALIPVMALTVIVEFGYSTPLIQAQSLERDQVRAVFTRVVLIGISLTALLAAFAPFIASLLGDASLASILRPLAWLPFLQSLAVVSSALLRRELRFKELQAAQMLAYWIGFLLVGLVAASQGFGVWSLVAAWLLQAAAVAAFSFWRRPHDVRPLVRRHTASFRNFAAVVLGTNICNWIIDNVDNLIVGRGLGVRDLGFYIVPYNLVRTPANHLVTNLQSVLLPVSALRQSELRSLRRAYLAVLSSTLVVAVPTFVGISLVPDVVLRALFGQSWVMAGPVLVPLALSMCCHSPMALAGPVLAGRGAPRAELLVQACTAICLVAAVALASRVSLLAVAWSVFAVYLVRLIGMTVGVVSVLHLSMGSILAAYGRAAGLALLTSAALMGMDAMASNFGPVSRLAADMVAAGSVLVVAIVAFPRLALNSELRSAAAQWLRGAAPGGIAFSRMLECLVTRLEPLA